MDKKPEVIFVVGPTAGGKSSFAIEKAKEINGEIINADSRQIYEGLVVGTASPSEEDKDIVPHHLYNFVNPNKDFSSSLFVETAEKKIREVLKNGKIPVVVGGSGLYLDNLIFGYKNPPEDKDVRKKFESMDTEILYALLEERDPEYAKTINSGSRYYMERALEIIELTGKTRTEAMKQRRQIFFDPVIFYKTHPRDVLLERIEKRINMIWDSWVDEVQSLISEYSDWSGNAFLSIGYKEIREFIEGKISKEKTIEKINILIRQYAKRQETWFRRPSWKNIKTNKI